MPHPLIRALRILEWAINYRLWLRSPPGPLLESIVAASIEAAKETE